ncbi:MAG TPA: cyclase family protein [Vicinamibacteria bacterium]|nr:cyclase family protein [Vicinamibacteria bacterium]
MTLLLTLLLAATAPPVLDLARVRLVDLTHAFGADTLYWPTSPSAFELRTLHRGPTGAGFFYSAYSFCAPEHGGTHLDAPVHFAEGRRAADSLPLEQLVAPAVVIDASARAEMNPLYRLTREDVLAWEQRRGRIEPGTIVLLRTGWGRRWPDRKAYLGDDTPGDASRLRFPSFGAESARLLLERRIAALGVDTASIDYGPSAGFEVHVLVNGADVPAFENVANLEALPERGAFVIALPMKIAGGSGGPLRIVALVPR